jgi:hypothetical protein
METCKFTTGDQVLFMLDADKHHAYKVLAFVPGSGQGECVYTIELTTDSSMKFEDVPESYMTDTDDGKGKITPEASASS